jgi:hypothetical protein
MVQHQKVQDVIGEKGAVQQSAAQVSVQPVPQQTETAIQRVTPSYPAWPTSKPGPQSMPVPPGMRPINAIRREQVAEAGYNQETGEPSTQSPFRAQPDARITEHPSFDQAETAQEALHRRKHRIEE